MDVQVRCPADGCHHHFRVPARKLGRSTTCPTCGVRMTARSPEVDDRLRDQETLIQGSAGEPTPGIERLEFVVLLDNIRSAWNVGSIFRTADGCGVRHVYLCGITATPPRPDIAKTALGAERALSWDYHAYPESALKHAMAAGYTPVALENEASATVDEFDWPKRVCLVVGNEVAGVSIEIMHSKPRLVSIPMIGVKNSFNVAVAFGIAAYSAGLSLRSRATSSVDPGERGES